MAATPLARTGDPPTRGPRRIRHLLWLLAPLALVLFHRFGSGLPDFARGGVGLIGLIVLPGWQWHEILLPQARLGPVERTARAFMLGIAWGGLLGLLAWFAGGDTGLGPVAPGPPPTALGRLSALLWAIPIGLCVGALFLCARPQRPRPDANEAPGTGPRSSRAARIVLVGLIAAAALLALRAGGVFGFVTDSPDHIAMIREMVESDRILPRTCFHADGDGATVDPRKGFFHVLLAALALFARLDVVRLWDLLPALLVPFALLIFATLARRLLHRESTVLCAMLLAVIWFGEADRGLFARLAYGNSMGLVLTWGVLALVLHHQQERNRARPGLLAVVAAATFGAVATHAFATAAIFFALGAFGAGLLVLRGPRYAGLRRLVQASVAAAAGAAPVIVWRLRFAAGDANLIHTHPQGLMHLSESLYLVSPLEWLHFLGPLGVAALPLSLLLWRRMRESDAIVYLLALSLAPPLLLLNPWLTALLEPAFGYLIARFALLVPFLFVIARTLEGATDELRRRSSRRRTLAALALYGLLLLVTQSSAVTFGRSHAPTNLERLRGSSILVWRDLMQRLDREIPEPAILLSDPLTSYAIPALTRHRVVGLLHQHGSPADSLALARLAACRDVLSPYIETAEKARLCRRFGVDYVLVNGAFDRRRDLFFCSAGPDLAARQTRVLDEDRPLLRRVLDLGAAGALYVVELQDLPAEMQDLPVKAQESPVEPAGRTAEILVDRLPVEAVPVRPDTVAGVTLAAVEIDRPSVPRGERLGMTLYWQRVGAPPRLPITIELRLETMAPRDALWTPRISKIHRNIREHRTQQAYLLRVEGRPLEGLFGCEHWPLDRYVVDRRTMRIWPHTVPGAYTLWVRWNEESFLPNRPLGYYLSDEAGDRGVPIAVIDIVAP